MKSEDYKQLLVNEYKNQELTTEEFEDTLMHFAKLYHEERPNKHRDMLISLRKTIEDSLVYAEWSHPNELLIVTNNP